MNKLLPLVLALVIQIVGCADSQQQATETKNKESGWPKLELPQIELPNLFGEKDTEAEATIMEIDAVAKLKSDSARMEGFTKIAARETLPEKAQIHLVRPVIKGLFSGADKEKVLLILIANPGFTHEAKMEVLKNLDQIKTEPGRITILRAINSRDKVVSQTKTTD